MDHQTTVNEQSDTPQTTSKGLAQNVSDFTYDVFALVELQAQLLSTDIKECREHALLPGLTLLAGVALGAACFPIALTAFALWVVQFFELSYALGFLIAGAVGAMTGMLLSVIGWVLFRRRLTVLGRSRAALIDNLSWIKKVLESDRVTRNMGNLGDESWRTET